MSEPLSSNEVASDTYPAPEHGWTCFHCGETFMHPNDARRHFGEKPISITACVLTAEDRKAVRMVRYLEGELETYKRYYHDGQSELEKMAVELSRWRNLFKQCPDPQQAFNHFDSMEGRALAAEESLAALRQPVETTGEHGK